MYNRDIKESIYRWRANNPEEYRRHSAICGKKYRERHPEKYRVQRNNATRRHKAKHQFNMSLEEYDAFMLEQSILSCVRNLYIEK